MHYYNDIIKFRNLNSGNALNKKMKKIYES